MNSSRFSSRVGSRLRACTLALAAAGAGCGGETVAYDAGASMPMVEGGPRVEGGGEPTIPTGGAACTVTSEETVAVKVRLTVTWPANASYERGTGPYVIWLLSRYAIDGQNNITSTTRICQIVSPPVTTSPGGCNLATSLPVGPESTWFASPLSEWKKVTRTTVATGVLGGRTVGSSITIHPSVTLFGLKDTSPYQDAATPWPPASGAPFGAAPDYEDEEGDGTPGITLLPMNEAVAFDLPVDLTGTCGQAAPGADRIFEASRIELSLYGTSTSCTEAAGTADVSLLDGRIVGCGLKEDGGLCTPDQSAFVDSRWPTLQPGAATFEQVMLAGGASATCDDAVAALPDAVAGQ
jgi:hypothetical protein